MKEGRCGRDRMVVRFITTNILVQSVYITTKVDQWFSLGTPVSSTNKTDIHD